ncbi:Evolutionarily conserved signaling intermediate in Toll pathway, mitochondrial, partial [Eufriesea mexicana]
KSVIIRKRTTVQLIFVNYFHNNQILYNKSDLNSNLIPYRFNVQRKEKETFLEIINKYKESDTRRISQLEFISSALKYMEEFNVNKDIEVYKALFSIFPEGKYVPQNKFQVMLYHYFKHQQAAISILNQMEKNFVIPDYKLEKMILNTFGTMSYVTEKCWSLLYWLPKFSELNPWPVPKCMPMDPKEYARMALIKLSSVDVQADIKVYSTETIPEAIDHTWIVSSISRSQQELLAVQTIDKSLTVEGPFNIWVDKYYINYFVLKGDPIKREIIYEDYHDVSDLKIPFWEKHNFKIPVTLHEQEDGVYYAICATGTSSKDSLLSWIRCLQKTNPILEKIPITFKLTSVLNEQQYLEEDNKTSDI